MALLALTVPSSLSALAAPEGDKVGDLIPAPTQRWGTPDGQKPQVTTTLKYDGGAVQPGQKVNVKADIRFDVHQGKHPEVFRPYVRVAVPKIFDVNIDDVKVPGPVKTKVVDAGTDKDGNKLFDIYFNYNEWAGDFDAEMPKLAEAIGAIPESGNVLGDGPVAKSGQTYTAIIPVKVKPDVTAAQLQDLREGKSGAKLAIQGRASVSLEGETGDYKSNIGDFGDFPEDKILQGDHCLVRSDFETGFTPEDDYGVWLRGLALSTRGVDYHGEGTVVRSLSGLKLRQLVPAKGLDANQIITITPRTGAEPIVLKSNIGANADVREQNNLKVYHHPNKNREARELMGMADIIRVRPSGSASELYGYTWDTPEYHPDWGNVPK